MAAPRQARARAMKARCARETRHSRRDAAPPAGSGRRGRRSTTPRATRPRPRPAAAARRERMRADPRSVATDRCRGRSATAGVRSRRTPTARRARRRRPGRPAQPCPSSRSCRRARAPSCRARQPSAVSSPGEARTREPSRRRTPAAGPRSAPDWTESSSAAGARFAQIADGEPIRRHRRPPRPRPPSNAPVRSPSPR